MKIVSGIVLSALLLAGGSALEDQILVNPGFETGSLSAWTNGRDFCGSVLWAVTSTECHIGSFCAVDTGNIELKQTFSRVSTTSITDISIWATHPDLNVTLLAVDFFTRVAATTNFLSTRRERVITF